MCEFTPMNMCVCVYALTGLWVHVCALQAGMCVCVCMFMHAVVHMCDSGSMYIPPKTKHSLIYLTKERT